MWKRYKVTWQFTGRVCGSVPLAKELIAPWLESRMPTNKPEEGRSLEEIKAEVLATIEETEERTTLGFQQDERGIFVRNGTIKAHFKDCANQLKDAAGVEIKALRSKVANRVFIEEDWVYFSRGGQPITAPDGEFERPVHVMTMQGPRNALKRIRYIDKPTLTFHLKVLDQKEVTGKVLMDIMDYGGIHGYGGERGMGEGRYEAETIPI